MAHITILNGPNLNLLGSREPEIYGHQTLADIEQHLQSLTGELGHEMVFVQTNSEGELVSAVQQANRASQGLILNAGAYTHTSVALLDALRSLSIPVIEVHLSNPEAREGYRKVNYVAPAATATIAGLGADGYEVALIAILKRISPARMD